MECLPEPNPDGKCVGCSKPAVTTDKRFCLKCLREIIAEMNPIKYGHGKIEKPTRRYGVLEEAPGNDDIIRLIENRYDGDMEIL
jgi:hypothetical protein